MSADNGIYILKTKDQYRVIHAQAIENVYYSHLDDNDLDEFVPTRLVEYFGNARYTRNPEIALRVANAMANNTRVLEYGIVTFTVNKYWNQIVREAKALASLEIETLKNKNSGFWRNEINRLEKILI